MVIPPYLVSSSSPNELLLLAPSSSATPRRRKKPVLQIAFLTTSKVDPSCGSGMGHQISSQRMAGLRRRMMNLMKLKKLVMQCWLQMAKVKLMVILLLIVKRARIKALVKDKKASVDAFGTYVEALVGDLSNMAFLSKALRGVRAIICPANIIMAYLQDGFFSVVGLMKGIEHVILLSQLDAYKGSGIFQAIINKRLRKYAERDEEVVITSGIPYTIVKAGLLQDVHSGEQGFCFDEGVASRGRLDREVAARICVEALDVVPTKGLIFEVVNGDEKVEDWKEWFAAKIRNAEELQ
ncbi:uncharacterized protein At2g37660, chloroplastic isoform X7 [Phalaenopsis equestris]|uniref:uncharacterized protein At2g37660, chloroplastic isoform X7 n=1 Tax=Phalaenopsis equestris TaxID=78828 RepID=UPI0009E362CF|nr:uncharacterized protein At2g37660, chloroplastic isoform X7 [Phalaenopsis equestris]